MTTTSILTLDSVTLVLPDGRPLFTDLTQTFDSTRTGLVGRNGVGKSLLGQLLAGRRLPSSGTCRRFGRVHLVDQQVIDTSKTVADLAQMGPLIAALERIQMGSLEAADFDTVGERWDAPERLRAHLHRHGLGHLELQRPVHTLSGGQAMRVALMGAWLSEADFLILDEPTNHLDDHGRSQWLAMMQTWNRGLLVISHDRSLLDHMDGILELSSLGLKAYGGNFSHYHAQKRCETTQATQQLEYLKRSQQQQARALLQQRQALDKAQARAGRKAKHVNQAKILVDHRQQGSQATLGKQRRRHREAEQRLTDRVREAAQAVESACEITVHAPTLEPSVQRQVLVLQTLRLPHGTSVPIEFSLRQGQRCALTGVNGSGKSTLLKMIAGQLPAPAGNLLVAGETALLDQHCSVLSADVSALEHVQQANLALDPSRARMLLAQLGLDAARVVLPSRLLSGGERMKAALAAILYRRRPVELLLLDEPGNHLDLPSLQALERMLEKFTGALIIASHDQVLLDALELDRYLHLAQPHAKS
ncbi:MULTISPECIES: ATP-binding cassette domain-containing protein [Pseudomonas]|uniref:ATP-binding cassette domain-containing protein n=1 Tax=Pseudomonas TaxID=286 RepID=UPI000F7925DE|nr:MULTISPECIES: ATP-binding cassette domain-containing protein [Pseudomonas]MDP9664029.1 ATPase subunit of ABC transporter with duplicated ATPase domains [Pseudomonas cremoricolorata]MBA1206504.1 ABC-F family ATP-binding cassette domain-containing protein [Pseudomonas fulva]MBA1216975.1 ABC-F family ATP-binding cassette domain-containing protein [Pseudomonas fulva]MDH0572461.1 ATP-binding cassette domain-containing protein [Pseudomonas fulva]RRW61262.1 ABC transporter ATP-binding protein [Pse